MKILRQLFHFIGFHRWEKLYSGGYGVYKNLNDFPIQQVTETYIHSRCEVCGVERRFFKKVTNETK